MTRRYFGEGFRQCNKYQEHIIDWVECRRAATHKFTYDYCSPASVFPTNANYFRSLIYEYFRVSYKSGGRNLSHPGTTLFRKNSADSTQSDSKLALRGKPGATQRMSPKDNFICGAQRAPATKYGYDRPINRNLLLGETSVGGVLSSK